MITKLLGLHSGLPACRSSSISIRLSSFCQKVLIALYENGTPFEPHVVDLVERRLARGLHEAVADRQDPGAARRGARTGRCRNRASSSSIWRSIIRAGRRSFPPIPTWRVQTRLRDRFYDLYVHDADAEDRRRPAAAGRQERSVRRRAGARRSCRPRYGMIEQRHGGRRPGRWAMPSPWPIAPPRRRCSTPTRSMPFGDSHRNWPRYFERLTKRPSFARALDEAEPYFEVLSRLRGSDVLQPPPRSISPSRRWPTRPGGSWWSG